MLYSKLKNLYKLRIDILNIIFKNKFFIIDYFSEFIKLKIK